MPDLFTRRLLITTGKGGVGKTTVSAALALLARQRGRRVLLLSLESTDRFGAMLGHDPVGHEVTNLEDGLDAINLDPEEVVLSFMRDHVYFQRFYRKLVDNPIWKSFYRVAPGLRELICLARICSLVEDRSFWSGRATYDLVVFDAPATGHGLGVLNVPASSSRLLVGSMRKSIQRIDELLHDPERTALNIVTLPEEMPVNEATELHQRVRSELRIPQACLFVNGSQSAPFSAEDRGFLDTLEREGDLRSRVGQALGDPEAPVRLAACARHQLARAELSDTYVSRARESVPLPAVLIPHLPNPRFGREALEQVVEAMAPQLKVTAETEA